MAEPTPTGGGRRRVAEQPRRRPSLLAVASVVIPLLTVAALALVRPAGAPDVTHEPSDRPLAEAAVVCPAAVDDAVRLDVASAELASGQVGVRIGGEDATTELTEGRGRLSRSRPVVVVGEDAMAPGLVATRSGKSAGVLCSSPQPEQWFTGVGAGPEHSSTLSLTNPDRGPAVADVTVLGPDGAIDVPELRGVTVPGGATRSYDFSEVVPMREALAIQVVVNRGRLGTHVIDSIEPLGRGRRVQQWLAPQSAPAERSYLTGVTNGAADRVLTLANPGDSEVRARVLLVTDSSEMVPVDSEEVRIRPQSVTEVDVSRLLRGKAARGTRALLVEAGGPVTSTLRTMTPGTLTTATAGARVESRVAAALPPGDHRLVVAGASGPGVLTWRSWDGDGAEIGSAEQVEVTAGRALEVALPKGAALVTAQLDGSTAVVSVVVGSQGATILPLADLVLTSKVPHVRPALR